MRIVKKKTKARTKAQVSTRVTPGVVADHSWMWLRRLAWPLFGLGVILVGLYLHSLVLFPITSVRVYDPGLHIAQQSVVATVNPLVDDGFFGAHLNRIKLALQALPWVETVDVARRWPGQIVIHLYEYTPVAAWNVGNLVTADGIIFTPAPGDTLPALPHLYGPPAEVGAMVQAYQRFAAQIAPLGVTITEVHLSERLSWDLSLSNGMIVKLGRTQMYDRLARFVRVYPQVFANNDKKAEYADLRYNHGMAVLWDAS